jgi:RNA polymerase sigma-70 factor, ECF subfamily
MWHAARSSAPQSLAHKKFMALISATPGARSELLTAFGRPTVTELRQPDQELIREAAAGQTHAYGALVRKYQDRLCTGLLNICGSLHEAEDVAQEAFVQAYLKLDKFAGQSAFYTWLYRIAINTAISRRRRKREEHSIDHSRDRFGTEPLDDGEAAEARVLRRERAGQVRQALNQLSDEHRTILVLREIDGRDYDAISEVLDLPVGTVRSRLHRARLQLKEQLEAIMGQHHGHN